MSRVGQGSVLRVNLGALAAVRTGRLRPGGGVQGVKYGIGGCQERDRVQDAGCRVQGSGSRVQGSGLGLGVGLRVEG